MENAFMIGLSRQLTLRRQMDVLANNIANANTPGFQSEMLLLEADPASRARSQDGPQRLQYVADWGVGRDFRPGEMEFTGRPLDVAVEGNGFFAVETENGDLRYTRDGRFHTDAEGMLVSSSGAPVLDDGGAPILIDPAQGSVEIRSTGSIVQNGAEIARLGLYSFEDRSALQKLGNGLYAAPDGVDADLSDAVVRQGYFEQSNTQPIIELTRMIETMRAYESVSKVLSQGEELSRKAVERLGRT